MLHYRTIDTKTLELLKKIQDLDVFKPLRLVGGTSLALQLGHRNSIDIDLFGKINLDKDLIIKELKKIGNVKTIHFTENINIFTVNKIKVDIVNYEYPWLENDIIEDDIKMAGLKDIAAMKLSAITGRGTMKDFIDIYFLLKHFSLKEVISFYEQKYNDGSVFLVLKSLAYFDDADEDVMPKMFDTISWHKVKETIKKNIRKLNT